jgi:WD40 repeat protein
MRRVGLPLALAAALTAATASAQAPADLTFTGHTGPVNSAAISSDGRLVLTAGDRTVRFWDAETRVELLSIPVAEEGDTARWAALSPAGDAFLVVSGPQGAGIATVYCFVFSRAGDAPAAVAVDPDRTLALAGATINAASYSGDGSRIVVADNDGTARVVAAATGEVLQAFAGHDGPVLAASFSPDGSQIVTAGGDASARIWDAATGEVLLTLPHPSGGVFGNAIYWAAYSPDGRYVATVAQDGVLRVFDAANADTLLDEPGHAGRANTVAFSADGALIVTAANDNTARLWSTETGEQLLIAYGHDADVNSAVFTPDGTRFLTAADDGTARYWPTDVFGNVPQ